MRTACVVIIYFQVWVVYLFIKGIIHKVQVTRFNFQHGFPRIKNPLREAKAPKLFHGILVIRIAGSELRFHGVLIIRIAGSELLLSAIHRHLLL
jgi:hypothetical protein